MSNEECKLTKKFQDMLDGDPSIYEVTSRISDDFEEMIKKSNISSQFKRSSQDEFLYQILKDGEKVVVTQEQKDEANKKLEDFFNEQKKKKEDKKTLSKMDKLLSRANK